MNKEEYITTNNLTDSHIDIKLLYQYRPTLPTRIVVGYKDGYPLFFEETASSLMKRHYGYNDKITRYKLVSNGKEVKSLKGVVITNNEYNYDFLQNFINTTDRNINLLDPKEWQRGRKKGDVERKKHNIWCSDEEFKYIKEFARKLRKELKK